MMKVPTLVALLLLSVTLVGGFSLSLSSGCEGRCDDPFDSSYSCQCNSACSSHHDCCDDYVSVCQGDSMTCSGKCGANYNPSLPCQCNDQCSQHGNCCQDYDDECGGGSTGGTLSNAELLELSELMIGADINNAGGSVTLNLQGTTHNGNTNDVSPDPLFLFVDPQVLEMPMYVKLAALYDNYKPSPGDVEDHTAQEQEEEWDFVRAVANTPLMNVTYNYLADKGAFTGTREDWESHIYNTWFNMYGRAKATLGSSGFEHVMIGEACKGGKVGGFHNWFHWYMLEQAGEINYLGYWETAEFGTDMVRGGGISFTYNWNGCPKPYGSMFIATSPELELALYTVCLMSRPDAKCHVSLMGTDVYIQTWTERYGGNILVGSSYPDWDL